MHLSLSEIWPQIARLVGTRVSLRGTVFVAVDSFLADSFDRYQAGERLTLCDVGLIQRHLLGVLPAAAGGPFIYMELITITGTVERHEEGFGLSHIADCTIVCHRHGTTVPIPF